jgi:hypothetical protein
MKDYGVKQGDMSPHVEDYQTPDKAYTQKDANKTTEYIARTDKTMDKQASGVRKQNYVGRYE